MIKKRKGNLLIGIIICISTVAILSGGIFSSLQNMIKFSNNLKYTMEVDNVLVSEINEYNSLNINNISDKDFLVTMNNNDIIVSVKVLDKEDSFIEFEITTTLNEITKSQKIMRNR